MAIGNRIHKTVLQLGAYGLITGTAAAATFATTPILVRVLGLKGFGAWSLLEPLILLAAGGSLLGVDHGVMKQIAHDRTPIREATGDLMPFVMLGIAIMAALASFAASIFLHFHGPLAALGPLIAVEALLIFLMSAFRASDWVGPYGAAQLGRSLLNLTGVICLATFLKGAGVTVPRIIDLRFVFLGVLALGLTFYLRPRIRLSWPPYKDATIYGIFILLTSILAMFSDTFDRYFVGKYLGTRAVGSYVVYIKLTAIVGQGISMPLMLWFPAERFRHLRDSDGGNQFFRTTALCVFGLLLLVAGSVYLCGHWLTRIIAPGLDYSPALLLLLLAAIVASGMTSPLNIGMLKPGLSHYNIFPLIFGSIAGFGFAVLFIPKYGLLAAGAAKAFCILTSLAFINAFSQHLHPVQLPYARMLCMILVTASLLIAMSGPLAGWNIILKLFAFSASLICAVFLLLRRDLKSHSASNDLSGMEAIDIEENTP